MRGHTLDLGGRWIKMDVTVDASDIEILLEENGITPTYYGHVTVNERFKLQSMLAEKFLFADMLSSDALGPEQKEQIRSEFQSRGQAVKKILDAIKERAETDPWV